MGDTESKVIKYIQGKHGMIGIIVSQTGDENENRAELHRVIAELAVKRELGKAKKKEKAAL